MLDFGDDCGVAKQQDAIILADAAAIPWKHDAVPAHDRAERDAIGQVQIINLPTDKR